jgi:SAM-dependent methyltransferase
MRLRARGRGVHPKWVQGTVAALLDEAARAPVAGWDFRWAAGRIIPGPLPWDFTALAAGALRAATAALDMGTGGGEFLDGFTDLPARMVATESWAPNVPVAARRLARRGVTVIHCAGAVDNAVQGGDPGGRLPFRTAAFDLVLNRHESFDAAEVARVLAPGGRFLTQQAGSSWDQFHALLGLPVPGRPAFDLDLLVGQAVRGGLAVEDAQVGREALRFADVGALAWYLRMVPWAVPGFDISTHRQALEAVADRDLVVYQERFLLSGRRD